MYLFAIDFAILKTLITFALTVFLLFYGKKYFILYLKSKKDKKNQLAPTTISVIEKILTICVFTLSFLILLEHLSISITPFLTLGAINGIVISWATQNLIGNYFGGVMLFMTSPFKKGDMIGSPTKKFQGKVKKIGWHTTEIETLETSSMFIPNSLFTKTFFQNFARMDKRLIEAQVNIQNKDLPIAKEIIHDIKQLLLSTTGIDTAQPLFVNLIEIKPFASTIDISFFLTPEKSKEFRQIKQDVLQNIVTIMNKRGALMPFPTQQIDLYNVNHEPDQA